MKKKRRPSAVQALESAGSGWRLLAKPATGLAVLILIAFGPSLPGGFLWDDVSLTDNVLVQSPGGLREIWLNPRLNEWEDNYWPLVYTTFALEHHLWGLWPPGYRAVNLFLHFLGTLLLWRVLVRLSVPGAWLGAALWALHPLRLESVAWIIARKDVLAGLFGLASAWLFLRHDETRRPAWLLASGAAFILALLSKTTVLPLPLALAVLLWYRHGRLERLHAGPLAAMLAIAALVGGMQTWYVKQGGGDTLGFTFAERIGIAGQNFWFYVRHVLLMPVPVALHPRPAGAPALPWLVIYPLTAVALVAAALVFSAKIGRGPAAALLVFSVMLIPVSGIVEFGFMRLSFVADRFSYFPAMGLLALIGSGLMLAIRRFQRAGLFVAFALVAASAAFTAYESQKYRDALTFWSAHVRRNPDAYEAHHQLGLARAQAGDLAGAREAFETALRLKPDYAEARNNLGMALLFSGDAAGARACFEQALRLKPDYAEAHNAMGVLLAQEGKHAQALKYFDKALQLRPLFLDAQKNASQARRDLGISSGP
ncbi:MAG: tetratricopeptide repeat protein [Candidatus Sumerlaeaceae bacterium]|nr:tetratricopeptide repeat protein [Candidatus Sumerlaeaceae bacterium]